MVGMKHYPNSRHGHNKSLFGPGWIVTYFTIAVVGIIMCCYGHAAINSNLYISGEGAVRAQEKALLYAPMDGIGEANPNYTPSAAPFIDAVGNKTFAVTGSILHSTEKVKIGKQSAYFTGNAPQRLIATVPNLDMGTKDFTISLWAYPETQNKLFPLFVSDSGNSSFQFFIADNNVKNRAISLSAGADRFLPTTTLYQPGAWVHYAVVRKDGVFTIYENGASIGSVSNPTRRIDLSSLAIGGNSSLNTPFIGYMDDLAFYDYAKWDSNFTPPTAPQTDANLLYLDFEEVVIDNTVYNQEPIFERVTSSYFTAQGTGAIRGVEDAEASNQSALYFEGVPGQRLNLENANLNFGTRDFTVSFWLKADKQTMSTPLIFGDEKNTGLRFYLAHNSTANHITLYNSSTALINTGASYAPNVWEHYAVTRKNGVFTIYHNGRAIGSTSSYTNLNVDLSKFALGGNSSTTNTAYKGQIDDFAIYDRAIYDGDFTPVTR